MPPSSIRTEPRRATLQRRFQLRLATLSLYGTVFADGLRARGYRPRDLALALMVSAWWITLALGACVAVVHAIAWGLRYV